MKATIVLSCTIALVFVFPFSKSALAGCMPSPDESSLVKIKIQKIDPFECECLNNKKTQKGKSKFILPGCLIKGKAEMANGKPWQSQKDREAPNSPFPKPPSYISHYSKDNELCGMKAGDTIYAKLHFPCWDILPKRGGQPQCTDKEKEYICSYRLLNDRTELRSLMK